MPPVDPLWKLTWKSHWAQSSTSVYNQTSAPPTSWLYSTDPISTTPASEQEPIQTSTSVFNSNVMNAPSPSSTTSSSNASLTLPLSLVFGLPTGHSHPGSDTTPPTTPSPVNPGPTPSPQPLVNDSNESTSPVKPPSASSSPRTASTSASTSTNTGAIAGGVVGGLALLALIAAGALLLVRHRRKSRPPPSAEFMHLARGPSELGFATMDGKKSPTLHRLMPGPLARRGSLEDEEHAPPMSPVLYRDPVLEKAQESAAMREKYGASDEGGYQ